MTRSNPVPAGQYVDKACLRSTDDKKNAPASVETGLSNTSVKYIRVVAPGTGGSLLGALFWYALGRWVGAERLKRFAARQGRRLTLSVGEVERAEVWFDRHGSVGIMVGRLISVVRSLISVLAGITRMSLVLFLTWTTLGTGVWTALLAAAGSWLESRYGLVAAYLDPISNGIAGLLILWYLLRVATFRPGR